jgi:acetyltransferase-like isoleucine patch superfamily enzyme
MQARFVRRALRARLRTHGRARIEPGAQLGRGVRLEVARGARLVLGAGCVVGDATWIQVRGGSVVLGAGARLGEHCRIVAQLSVTVGPRAAIAEGVVMADAEPVLGDLDAALRSRPSRTAPVAVGPDAVVGPGAALLPGAAVAAGERVPARAVLGRTRTKI